MPVVLPKLIIGDAASELAYERAQRAIIDDAAAHILADALAKALGEENVTRRESYAFLTRGRLYYTAVQVKLDGQTVMIGVTVLPKGIDP